MREPRWRLKNLKVKLHIQKHYRLTSFEIFFQLCLQFLFEPTSLFLIILFISSFYGTKLFSRVFVVFVVFFVVVVHRLNQKKVPQNKDGWNWKRKYFPLSLPLSLSLPPSLSLSLPLSLPPSRFLFYSLSPFSISVSLINVSLSHTHTLILSTYRSPFLSLFLPLLLNRLLTLSLIHVSTSNTHFHFTLPPSHSLSLSHSHSLSFPFSRPVLSLLSFSVTLPSTVFPFPPSS